MIEIVDFSNCPLSDRDLSYAGRAGEKRGIVYQGSKWILKFPKSGALMREAKGLSYVTSPLCEFIGSHVFSILGYEVQETVMGVCFDGRKWKPVCACKDFIGDDTNEELIPFTALRNDTNDVVMERNDRMFFPASNLNEVIFQLDNNTVLKNLPGPKERFWDESIVDLLINNNDRHEDNWGVLKFRKENTYRIAPIYDNGNSFYGKHTDTKIASILSDEEKLMASSLNGVTAYENDNGDQIRNDAFLGIDNPDLRAAIVRVYKKWVDNEQKIKDFIMSIPSESHGLLIMSELRKRFCIRSMEIRFERLLEPQYRKIVG